MIKNKYVIELMNTCVLLYIFFLLLWGASQIAQASEMGAVKRIKNLVSEKPFRIEAEQSTMTLTFERTVKKTVIVHANQWQQKFSTRCHEEFDAHFCQYADAQIQSEGGYNPHRWAEFAEGYCSFGMFQNYVCGHMGWSHATAKSVYYGILNGDDWAKKHAYLLDGDWQIEELLRRYEKRIARKGFSDRWCTGKVILGEALHQNVYCAIRLHNWHGGRGYVARVVHKKQELYD